MSSTEVTSLVSTNPAVQLPFELAALAQAKEYQSWVFRTIEPFLGQRILEVGAGIGNMSNWLPVRDRLILTEHDTGLLELLQKTMKPELQANPKVSVNRFDLLGDDLAPYEAENLDTIVSFNVLEHIENDGAALERLCRILRTHSGPYPRRLITFVPAHSWAYGSMDKTFGHYRRYSAGTLRTLFKQIAPEGKLTLRYFNLLGLLGWVFNGRILKKPSIGMESIHVFEKLCPLFAPLDDFAHRTLKLPLGQSLLAVVEWNA